MTAVLTHRIGLRLGRSQSIEDSEQKKSKTPHLFLFGNDLKFHPLGFTFRTIHIFTSFAADEVVCYRNHEKSLKTLIYIIFLIMLYYIFILPRNREKKMVCVTKCSKPLYLCGFPCYIFCYTLLQKLFLLQKIAEGLNALLQKVFVTERENGQKM